MPKYVDNTMIGAFKRCPRQYYFRHVRHWVPDTRALPLSFGLAWHEALHTAWSLASQGQAKHEVLGAAIAAFLKCWRDEGLPTEDDLEPTEVREKLGVRRPGVAAEMLHAYLEARWEHMQRWRVLGIERPFIVPIWPPSGADGKVRPPFYVGRIDLIVEDEQGEALIIEHKTTTQYARTTGFRQSYLESFNPNAQVDGYLYAASLLLNRPVRQLWVDAALVHDRERHFKFIPCSRREHALEEWLWSLRYWVNQLESEEERGWHPPAGTPIMFGWARNDQHCFSCPYRDPCTAMLNPEERDEPPLGFRKEPWDPLEINRIRVEEESDA